MSDIDLSAIRARLASASGPTFWRSLDEVAETPEFQQYLQREFPENAAEWSDPAGRRQFLKLMGASLALAGITGCTRQPTEHIVPYVVPPEGFVPGKTQLYATAMPRDGFAEPVLAVSHHGRPIKIEPNPEHPASGGGTSRYAQASVLDLYDPDRSQTLTYEREIRSWTDFVAAMAGALAAQQSVGGAGLRLLTRTVTSPTLLSQIEAILNIYPAARWISYEPSGRDLVADALNGAFGQRVEPRLALENADVILSLDGDFMDCGAAEIKYARAFADRRRLEGGGTTMNRLYMVESRTSNTGTKADHRLAVRAADIDGVARAVAAGLGVPGVTAGALPAKVTPAWVAAVVADLKAAGPRALVVAGDHQAPAVQVLAAAMNQALGAVGTTVDYLPSQAGRVEGRTGTLQELVGDMAAGKVELLLILDGNPVYDAPVDLGFADQIKKVGIRVHAGLYKDETAALCQWHVPLAHYLESWSDLRAFDGTVTIVQPLINPLYETAKAPSEVLAAFGDNPAATGFETLRAYWEGRFGEGTLTAPDGTAFADFEKFWRRAVHDGFVPGTAAAPATLGAATIPAAAAAPRADAIEVTYSLDPTVHDGRYANNGWLQELPKPLNKVTWDNVIVLSPKTAERLGIAAQKLTAYEAQVATVTLNGRSVSGPVWVQAGHPDNSVNLQLGYGRPMAGRVGTGLGYNANSIRRATAPWFAVGAQVQGTGETYRIASTQLHFNMEQRAIVRTASLPVYKAEPTFAQHMTHVPKYEDTLHNNEWQYEGYKWGMIIDLNACDGCNACVVACVSENNIPVVGKEQVATGREMHWIRVDRYYEGDLENPTVHDQPLTCMQCENAPCEVVCPVAATVHNQEGLNDMVYNRCVGTRYCANNCPYKVRRFNFLLYQDWDTPTLKMVRNPEVTVRSRGVMEKCTYCVQRINSARQQAKVEDRRIRDGEVRTACQTACPTQAIHFGDLNDPSSKVAQLRTEPRNYGLLEDLNTRPRTTYLAAVRNPNPVLAPEAVRVPAHGGGHGETTGGDGASPSPNDDHGKAATAGAAPH